MLRKSGFKLWVKPEVMSCAAINLLLTKMCGNALITMGCGSQHFGKLTVSQRCFVLHRQMCSTPIHICSQWLQVRFLAKMVQVAMHMAVHVQDAITRSRGDDAATKTLPLLADFPACVTGGFPFAQTSAPSFFFSLAFVGKGSRCHVR